MEKPHQALNMKTTSSLKNSQLVFEPITKSELAKRLDCTSRHIDNLTARGLFNKIKVGALCRYDWAEVAETLKAQRGKEAA